jgi:hypothetical protein
MFEAMCRSRHLTPFSKFIHTVKCFEWSKRPVHREVDSPTSLAPVYPPPTTASSTRHCLIETVQPCIYRKFSYSGRPILQQSPYLFLEGVQLSTGFLSASKCQKSTLRQGRTASYITYLSLITTAPTHSTPM